MSADGSVDRPGTGTGTGDHPGPDDRVVEVFRAGAPRLLAIVWWAVSVAALADIALHGRDRASLTVALALVATDLALYAGAWRPAVRLYPRHVVVVGAARDRSVRLSAVTGAGTRGALRLHVGERTVTTATVTASARESSRAALGVRQPPGRGRDAVPSPGQRRMDQQTVDAAAGATQAGYAASRIREHAERARRDGDDPGPPPGIATHWVWWPAVLTASFAVTAVIVGTT